MSHASSPNFQKPEMNTLTTAVAPEDEVKTLTLSYPEFCLLIEAVAARANARNADSRDWIRLYKRLGGQG